MKVYTAIEKALRILLEFNHQKNAQGTFEISESLNLSKPTTSRIMNTLAEYGFLLRDPETRKYSLGPWFISQALGAMELLHKSLVVIAKPHLDRLCAQIDETVTFTVFFAPKVVIMYIADKPGLIRINFMPGDTTAPNAAASAKSIYAFLEPKTMDGLLSGKLERFTTNTITDLKTLKAHYRQIRKQGYAVDNEEFQLDLKAIGVPVFDTANKPIGAVSAVGISSPNRWGRDSPIIPKLKETAEQISTDIYRYSHS